MTDVSQTEITDDSAVKAAPVSLTEKFVAPALKSLKTRLKRLDRASVELDAAKAAVKRAETRLADATSVHNKLTAEVAEQSELAARLLGEDAEAVTSRLYAEIDAEKPAEDVQTEIDVTDAPAPKTSKPKASK